MTLGDVRDLGRKRGRKERRLHVVGEGFENRLEFVREAEVEHFVGFVEHERADLREVERALLDVVERAAGRRHDDVRPAAQGADLAAVFLTAVDRRDVRARSLAEAVEGFAHLQTEFARGRKNEHERQVGFLADDVALEKRQRKGGRLASAGRGHAENVAAGKESGDGFGLNRGRFFKTELRDGVDDRRGESEIGKSGHGVL